MVSVRVAIPQVSCAHSVDSGGKAESIRSEWGSEQGVCYCAGVRVAMP